jgi:hypothetical protein
MAEASVQSTSSEEHVRAAIEQTLRAQGGVTVENQPGRLVMDLGGSVGSAYLAGGFRNKMKMPQRMTVTLAGGEGGSGITLEVTSRGTGSGGASGGLLGLSKQKKAEQAWLGIAVDAIPDKVATPGTAPPPAPA